MTIVATSRERVEGELTNVGRRKHDMQNETESKLSSNIYLYASCELSLAMGTNNIS